MEVNKATTTFNKETIAKDFNRRVPFRIAVSPPVIAMRKTIGESRMKCKTWLPQLNVQLSSNGLRTTQRNIPVNAVNRLHKRMVETVLTMRLSSLDS